MDALLAPPADPTPLPPSTRPRRRLAVVSLGTRGDAQPLLAVAQALQAAGAEVLFLCMDPFLSLARDSGVPASSLGPGMDATLAQLTEGRSLRAARTPCGQKLALDSLIRSLSRAHWTAARAAFQSFRPDTALLHGVAFFSLSSLCELMGIKMAVAHAVPLVATRTFAPPFHLYRDSRLGCLNALQWRLFDFVSDRLLTRRMADELRAEEGMPPLRTSVAHHFLASGHVPLLVLFSPQLGPRPPDWPEYAHILGAPVLREGGGARGGADGMDGYAPPARLARFLAAGEPPLVVTLGSMASAAWLQRSSFRRDSGAVLRLAVRAALRLRRRVLVLGEGLPEEGLRALEALRWAPPGKGADRAAVADWATTSPGSSVCALGSAVPHSWLFPRCAALCCHGGAGTVQAGLRSGLPIVVLSCLPEWDQNWMARLLVRRGLSPAAFDAQRVGERELARAFAACGDAALRARVRDAAALERATDGAAAAAALLLDGGGAGMRVEEVEA